MRRKLVKQGTTTMMVSLPVEWVKSNKFKKGDEVNIRNSGSTLVISPLEKVKKPEAKIRLTESSEASIKALVTTVYRRGYNIIHVYFDSESKFNTLNKIVKTELIGFDITRKEKGHCIVQNLTEPSLDKFDAILNKIFYNISELFSVSKKRMEGQDLEYEEIEERIRRYNNFCRRIISIKNIAPDKSEVLWAFLTILNHGQRELYKINQILDKPVSDSTKDFLLDAEKIYEMIRKGYTDKDMDIIAKVYAFEDKLLTEKFPALIKSDKDPRIVNHIMMCIRMFFQSNSSLAGFIL